MTNTVWLWSWIFHHLMDAVESGPLNAYSTGTLGGELDVSRKSHMKCVPVNQILWFFHADWPLYGQGRDWLRNRRCRLTAIQAPLFFENGLRLEADTMYARNRICRSLMYFFSG